MYKIQQETLKKIALGYIPLFFEGDKFYGLDKAGVYEFHHLLGYAYDSDIKLAFSEHRGSTRTGKFLNAIADGVPVEWAIYHDKECEKFVTWHKLDHTTPIEVYQCLFDVKSLVFRHMFEFRVNDPRGELVGLSTTENGTVSVYKNNNTEIIRFEATQSDGSEGIAFDVTLSEMIRIIG